MNKYKVHFWLDGKVRILQVKSKDYFELVNWFYSAYPSAKVERFESLD